MDIYKLANYSEFIKERMTVKLPYRNDYIRVYAYNKGKKVFEGTLTEWNEKHKTIEHTVSEKDKEICKPEYDEVLSEYNKQRNSAYNQWKEELFKECNADINNQQHLKLYDKIYNDYSSSMNDVVHQFDDYMDIFR